jgi:hypothetical protein
MQTYDTDRFLLFASLKAAAEAAAAAAVVVVSEFAVFKDDCNNCLLFSRSAEFGDLAEHSCLLPQDYLRRFTNTIL